MNNSTAMMELFPPVRIDLMRKAMEHFFATLERSPPDDRNRYKKAAAAVEKVVEDDWRHQMSYVARCHAFRNITKKLTDRTLITTFGKWLITAEDGGMAFHEAVIDAIAIAPVNGGGTNFRKTDFLATVEQIAREHYPETSQPPK